MNNYTKTSGLVLRCSKEAVILEVLYSEFAFDSKIIINKSFSALAQVNSLDQVLHFLEAVRQFGFAEGWHLNIQIEEQPHYITFSGVRMGNQFIIIGSLYVEPQEDGSYKSSRLREVGKSAEISMVDNVPFTAEMDETELLDELSRLNNELINNKRELIRQKIGKERKKGIN
ncbi:hypothetical protein [Adhaeribacter aquaticus]|uniref:hypothetical protein n=1 Tax=Adhaeribacter aquaticus TaxID=299567 RepID=UPI0003FAF397|nr:hypothetical protein [Adhaeribacter aquaticus]